jgi:hypothetical protein
MTGLILLVGFTFVVNLPLGYWREGLVKFSPAWFVAVHAAVPLIVGMRLLLDVAWQWQTLPLMVAAYFLGQIVGARHRRAIANAAD